MGYSPWRLKRVRHNLATEQQEEQNRKSAPVRERGKDYHKWGNELSCLVEGELGGTK